MYGQSLPERSRNQSGNDWLRTAAEDGQDAIPLSPETPSKPLNATGVSHLSHDSVASELAEHRRLLRALVVLVASQARQKEQTNAVIEVCSNQSETAWLVAIVLNNTPLCVHAAHVSTG